MDFAAEEAICILSYDVWRAYADHPVRHGDPVSRAAKRSRPANAVGVNQGGENCGGEPCGDDNHSGNRRWTAGDAPQPRARKQRCQNETAPRR